MKEIQAHYTFMDNQAISDFIGILFYAGIQIIFFDTMCANKINTTRMSLMECEKKFIRTFDNAFVCDYVKKRSGIF